MYSRRFFSLVGLLVALLMAFPAAVWAGEVEESEKEIMMADETAEGEEAQEVLTSEAFSNEDVYYQRRGGGTARTVLGYALTGGAIGAIIGTGAWLLTGRDWSAWTIAQFAGGGVVVGGAVGLIMALLPDEQPPVASAVEEPSSVKWIKRDMPETFEMPVLELRF